MATWPKGASYFVVTPGIGAPNSEIEGLTVVRAPTGWLAGLAGAALGRGSGDSGGAGAVGLLPAGAAYEGPPTPAF
ncbi:hypothetical protein [Bradyrhizobium sp. LHD-71]|uniref:hypothetical protein n=1 Tax=Bradyrhizobium sp. LHD-71 TaxID=3072141 RepID=UPI00280CE8CE|nr:hypothetical protein [Bradyrhizobium sp. LHD-71]MDQ8727660.1 hypothetical protein [Bradyrhizobium sp. LHD-71]